MNKRSAWQLGITMCALAGVVAPVWAGTIRVPKDYPSIQQGVDAASDGDLILVAPGVYTGVGNRGIVVNKQDLEIRSEAGASATIVDVEGSLNSPSRAFYVGAAGTGATIEGFTLTGGWVDWYSGTTGASVQVSMATATIRNCVFLGNEGNGSVGCRESDVTIQDCDFRANSGGYGVAVNGRHSSTVSVFRCTIENNQVLNTGWGGSLHFWASSALLSECEIDNPGDGTGVVASSATVSMSGSLSKNTLIADNSEVELQSCTFTECRINGALRLSSSSLLMNGCTLVGNSSTVTGEIVLLDGNSQGVISNSIFAFNEWRAVGCAPGSEATLSCTDVFGHLGGDWVGCLEGQGALRNNLSADPEFCRMEEGDFTLRSTSPCAPKNSNGCDLVGAHPVGCDSSTPVDKSTWGRIKGVFRD